MKAWHLLVVAVIGLQAFGWFSSCQGLSHERKQREIAFQSYRADSAAWAKRNARLNDSLVGLRKDSTVLAGRLAIARQRALGASQELQAILAHSADTSGQNALRLILDAGERCDASLTNCEARAEAEHQRAEAAIQGRLAADRAASEGHAWAKAEIRHARAWKPFSLRPPGILWGVGLILAGLAMK